VRAYRGGDAAPSPAPRSVEEVTRCSLCWSVLAPFTFLRFPRLLASTVSLSPTPDPPGSVALDRPLRIVLLEDVATDAELIRAELKREGIEFDARRVTSRDGFELALEATTPDLILTDYSLPAFDGCEALDIALEKHPDVPVVFVSGAIGEERAIETLKQGATDYVLKDRLSRLGPAVRRALRESAERAARLQAETALREANERLERTVRERTADLREANAALRTEVEERKQVEAALRESEAQLASIIHSAIDAIISIDADLRVQRFNPGAEKVFGRVAEDVQGRSIAPLLGTDLAAIVDTYIDAHPPDDDTPAQGRYISASEDLHAIGASGSPFCVEATLSRIDLTDTRRYLLILRDVHEVKQAEERLMQLQSERVYLREEIESEYNFKEIIGQSPAIQAVFDAIDQVAATDTTVLVCGETGTGKELVARALHDRSPRRDETLVKVNCAALPADLIESELFGHEKGAFTGATKRRIGRFELADGGSLFLDEIGELPLQTQAKLLRALQEQEFERVGGSETVSVDARIIAATNRNLEQDVEDGSFRQDLYYRLNIFPIGLPPLRSREGDVRLLANHFVEKFATRTGKSISSLSPGALSALRRYDWPGNVRELANILERAVILTEGNTIQTRHLSIDHRPHRSTRFATLEESQRRHIARALERTNGVVGGDQGAAQLLDVNRTTLLSRMDRLRIDPAKYR